MMKTANAEEISQNSLNNFPLVDLTTIDQLWQENSNGKFGFSAQNKLFRQFINDRNKFGERLGWRVRDSNGNYSWLSNTGFNSNFSTATQGQLPSSLWVREDSWFENGRDRLITLFARIDSSSASQ